MNQNVLSQHPYPGKHAALPRGRWNKPAAALRFTGEQENVASAGGSLCVQARAGAGKTSTLVEMATRRRGPILYLVYNKTAQIEAKGKMPGNVSSLTLHGLAYRYMHRHVPDFQFAAFTKEKIIAMMGLTWDVQGLMFAGMTEKFLSFFFNSNCRHPADTQCGDGFVDTLPPAAGEFFSVFRSGMVVAASRAWEGMLAGQIPYSHDGYLKKFCMDKPILPYGLIMLDEAQDSTQAVLDLLLAQPSDVVAVGDSHQQIYAWRHAVDILNSFPYPQMELSQSFRFGPALANVAQGLMVTLKGLEGFTMRGTEGIPTKASCSKAYGKRCIISRGNASLFAAAVEEYERDPNQKFHFEGGTQGYRFLDDGVLAAVDSLRRFQRPQAPFFKNFTSLGELEACAKVLGDAETTAVVNLSKRYGANLRTLAQGLRNAGDASNKSDADIVLTTAHKSKGQEYDAVEIVGDSFTDHDAVTAAAATAAKAAEVNPGYVDRAALVKTNEEINLLYVAITRARLSVTLPEWMADLGSLEAVRQPF